MLIICFFPFFSPSFPALCVIVIVGDGSQRPKKLEWPESHREVVLDDRQLHRAGISKYRLGRPGINLDLSFPLCPSSPSPSSTVASFTVLIGDQHSSRDRLQSHLYLHCLNHTDHRLKSFQQVATTNLNTSNIFFSLFLSLSRVVHGFLSLVHALSFPLTSLVCV